MSYLTVPSLEAGVAPAQLFTTHKILELGSFNKGSYKH